MFIIDTDEKSQTMSALPITAKQVITILIIGVSHSAPVPIGLIYLKFRSRLLNNLNPMGD